MQVNADCRIETVHLKAERGFPNNPRLPLLVYNGAFQCSTEDLPTDIETLFEQNGWYGTWRDGVYPFHHYHSNTHEVLGCYRGRATVQFGGPDGQELTIEAGDVAILPAGTAHKKTKADRDFAVVGAYPGHSDYDMHRGNPEEDKRAAERIATTPVPETDPVFGTVGGLKQHWD